MGWEVWLIIAAVCLIIEFATVDFSFLMLSGGALAGSATACATDSLTIQAVVFASVSIVLLVLVRPWAKNHFNPKGSRVGSAQAQVGRAARALTIVDATAGRVKIGGDVWSARSVSGTIPEGSDVVVVEIDGAVAVVRL